MLNDEKGFERMQTQLIVEKIEKRILLNKMSELHYSSRWGEYDKRKSLRRDIEQCYIGVMP